MDAIDLNSERDDDDDDWDTDINGLGTPKDVRDYDTQRDPTLAENVGVPALLRRSSKISKKTSDNRCLVIGVFAARPTRVPAGEEREHEELVVKLEKFGVGLFAN